MINIVIVIWILFLHWIGDFYYQTDYMALNKGKEWKALLEHTILYSIVMLMGMFFLFGSTYKFSLEGMLSLFRFVTVTFLCHTIQDYITSRENAKLAGLDSKHNFFTLIGFDQFLHFTQLIFTYWLFTK